MKTPSLPRKDFKDADRAAVFARDHGTCGFSGISLWILDHGILPTTQMDWVDHIRPASRGGLTSQENGICASHTFNQKKRGNGADNVYFFKNGKITTNYLLTFGCPPEAVIQQLQRLSALTAPDWYFNRCIFNTFIAFDWRIDKDYEEIERKRNDEYWLASAWKRLTAFQSHQRPKDIRGRGLTVSPLPFGSDLLLQLEAVTTYADFRVWVEEVYPFYHASRLALSKFLYSDSASDRRRVIRDASTDPKVYPEILKILNLRESLLLIE